MRSVIIGVSGLALAGCATVSMMPNEATVKTELSEEQSALRVASDGYCDHVADAGWVQPSGGFMDLASVLLKGRDGATASQPDYAARIEAETAQPGDVIARIQADARTARAGLADVSGEARQVLRAPGRALARGDVTSFERSLVRAQRASRAFSNALDIALARTTLKADQARAAITAFDGEIDAARRLADDLAAAYAGLGPDTA